MVKIGRNRRRTLVAVRARNLWRGSLILRHGFPLVKVVKLPSNLPHPRVLMKQEQWAVFVRQLGIAWEFCDPSDTRFRALD